jgi:NADH-quinone oxidoreductase subunit A
LGVYAACVAAVVMFMVGGSFVLGQRRKDRTSGQPYESGIVSQGSARLRMTSQFYLMAILFVIFDLEAVFLFAWSVAVRELGWKGYGAIALFIGLLLVALGYLWRVGALAWGPRQRLSPIDHDVPGAGTA